MTTLKAVKQNNTKRPAPLSQAEAIQAVHGELLHVESILYVALKAFTAPGLAPGDDKELSAYSILSIAQERLEAVLRRIEPQAADDGYMVWTHSLRGDGLACELAKFIGVLDLTMEATGNIGYSGTPAVVRVAHEESLRMLRYVELLAKFEEERAA